MTGFERVSMISLKARFTARLPDGRAVFVKVGREDDKDRACLSALNGLAVPRAVCVPKAWRWAGVPAGRLVVEERLAGVALDHAGLSPMQLLGAWAFVAEQFVAFRRRQVLYTDIKCTNFLAARRPFKVTVIDFGYATAVENTDRYEHGTVGLTPGFEAPEHRTVPHVNERTIVFQLGMLLLHCWTGALNTQLHDCRIGLPRLRRELERLHAPGVAELASAILAEKPSKRPSGYEAVLAALRRPGCLPPKALALWRELRDPFERPLAELRLERP